jgi:hypothetical protein
VGRKRERETHRQAKDDHFLSLQAQARHAQNLSGQYKDAAPQRAAKEETGGLSGVRGRCPWEGWWRTWWRRPRPKNAPSAATHRAPPRRCRTPRTRIPSPHSTAPLRRSPPPSSPAPTPWIPSLCLVTSRNSEKTTVDAASRADTEIRTGWTTSYYYPMDHTVGVGLVLKRRLVLGPAHNGAIPPLRFLPHNITMSGGRKCFTFSTEPWTSFSNNGIGRSPSAL